MSGGGAPDFFYREAHRLGYVARSAFKLMEIQKQYKVIKPGASVLDLGCAPGAWLQVACQNLGPLTKGGAIIGVDVKKVKVPTAHCDGRVQTFCGDVMKPVSEQLRGLLPQGKGYSVILSDMCPPVSGIRAKDTTLSCELGMRALTLALGEIRLAAAKKAVDSSLEAEEAPVYLEPDAREGMLQSGGNLVIKLLECEESQGFPKFCKEHFKKISWLRPKATRSSSTEIYLICKDLK
ncbi:hypothetical protein SUGI_1043640 [Cryptomeria japonica]|uniref:uncharacterized protein LOC131034120 n=1 Tax=Cryptomeria japonica TaxID=3369 RepID=UPI00241494F5|nr:uncharacterized protein LOC131034120 [Cryptomeria japonica]GLJ49353.1 hypothetical protein SUGI_1043640 [Cryptomeria japonica]